MSPMPQTANASTRKPTTAAMMALPSQEAEALRRPRSMANGSWLEGGKGAHHKDRADPTQPSGLRLFAPGAGLRANGKRSPDGARHGEFAPPAGRGQLEDERAQELGG